MIRRILCSLALFACVAVELHAADKSRPMTVADIMQIRNVSDVQLAPNGTQIAYVVARADFKGANYSTELWVVATKGGSPQKLTNAPKRNDTPRWSPDSKSLAFLSDRSGKPQIWTIPLNGGEAKQVTDLPQGVRDCDWSPDGTLIAFRAVDPETAEEKKRKEEKNDVILVDQAIKRTRLHLLDLATGKTRKVNTGNVHVVDFDWCPDSRRLAFTHQPTPSADDARQSHIAIADLGTDDVTEVHNGPTSDSQPRWSPDGKQLAYLSRAADWLGNVQLFVIPIQGGKQRSLTAEFDEHVAPFTARGFDWSHDGKQLYFVAEQKTARPLFACTVADGKVNRVSTAEAVIHSLSTASGSDAVAVLRETVSTPAEVYLHTPANKSGTCLTDTNPQLTTLDKGVMEVVRWRGQNGLEIEGVLVKPVGYKTEQKYPLLVYVHGGPALNFRLALTPYGTSPQTQRYPLHVLAGEGYAILCPNPRGSTGYGEKFRAANRKDWGGADLQDILLGADALVKQGLADEKRLGLMGWSYGGFMTAWAITQTDRFKAASVGAGVTHPTSLFGLTDIPSFMVDYYGGPPWAAPENYFRCSAVQHAGKIKTPTLIQHGEKDDRVPLPQGQEFYGALKYRKVPTEFAIYPRSGHHVAEPTLQADVMQRNVDWFNRWLKK